MPFDFSPEQLSGEEYYQSTIEGNEATLSTKQMIDITVVEAEAKDLIANISEKSIETLSRFTTGEPVKVDDLMGDMHILEQREHPFWTNVNSDSDGT